VKFLLDTHILIWSATQPERLSPAAQKLLKQLANQFVFSTTSIWEVATKFGLGRRDFQFDHRLLRGGFFTQGFTELPLTGDHAVVVAGLPLVHKDPFDRILIAQAIVEGIPLVTSDPVIAKYSCPLMVV
jgi:PIN domain nuclease of toxin-antitoxin system